MRWRWPSTAAQTPASVKRKPSRSRTATAVGGPDLRWAIGRAASSDRSRVTNSRAAVASSAADARVRPVGGLVGTRDHVLVLRAQEDGSVWAQGIERLDLGGEGDGVRGRRGEHQHQEALRRAVDDRGDETGHRTAALPLDQLPPRALNRARLEVLDETGLERVGDSPRLLRQDRRRPPARERRWWWRRSDPS